MKRMTWALVCVLLITTAAVALEKTFTYIEKHEDFKISPEMIAQTALRALDRGVIKARWKKTIEPNGNAVLLIEMPPRMFGKYARISGNNDGDAVMDKITFVGVKGKRLVVRLSRYNLKEKVRNNQ